MPSDKGKVFRFSVNVSAITGTWKLWIYDRTNGAYVGEEIFTTTGVKTVEFNGTSSTELEPNLVSTEAGTISIDASSTVVSVTQIGCVLNLTPSSIGHNQWLDNSGNMLTGEVDGAIPVNLPANAVEKTIKTTITADTTWSDIVPAGYILERMIFVETAGNTGTLSLGTSDGATDVFLDQAITASSITVVEINKMWSTSATQTLDLNDDGSGTWNSASVDVTLLMRKISMN